MEVLGGTAGGAARSSRLRRVMRLADAGKGDVAPLLRARLQPEARAALERGATLLTTPELAAASGLGAGEVSWVHPHAPWVLAELLDRCDPDLPPPVIGSGIRLGLHVVLEPGTVIGKNVTIGPGAILGRPGFGWATSPAGKVRQVPQLGGVVIEDDVSLGSVVTVDAGTLGPTRIRRGAKLDSHVHVGHNCDIGEESIVAAQCGFAGSVVLGRGVLVGGQAGVADHVRVGDGARIAAKSGVIGDVPPGAVVAGYPAVSRVRWLRAVAFAVKRPRRGRE